MWSSYNRVMATSKSLGEGEISLVVTAAELVVLERVIRGKALTQERFTDEGRVAGDHYLALAEYLGQMLAVAGVEAE